MIGFVLKWLWAWIVTLSFTFSQVFYAAVNARNNIVQYTKKEDGKRMTVYSCYNLRE